MPLASDGSFSFTVASGHNGDVQIDNIALGAGKSIVDDAGNAMEALTGLALTVGNATVDGDAPQVTNLATDQANSKWTWDCSESTCDSRSILTNTSTATNPTEAFAANANERAYPATAGTYYIHVQVRDKAGNLSSVVSSTSPVTITDGHFVTSRDKTDSDNLDSLEDVIAHRPQVTQVIFPEDGNYSAADSDSLDFTVIFDTELVIETGDNGGPYIEITVGELPRRALLVDDGGLNAAALKFSYTVVAEDSGLEGITWDSEISLPDGTTLRSDSGVDAILDIQAPQIIPAVFVSDIIVVASSDVE